MEQTKTEEEYCSDIEHKDSYHYGCPKCWEKCDNQKERLSSGNWCDCICNHNTFNCRICKKPVKILGGMYYFVTYPAENKLKANSTCKDQRKNF